MTHTAAIASRDRLDILATSVLLLLCLTWGLNYALTKFVNLGLQPVFHTGLRSALAGAAILAWCAMRKVRLFERDGSLVPGIVAGTLFGVEFALIALGLDYTSASRSVVFVYTMPFVVAIGAHFLVPGERITPVSLGGLFLAFLGVLAVFSDKLSLPGPNAYFGDFLSILAAVLWGAVTILIKTTSLRRISAEKVLLYQLGVSAVVLLAIAPLFGPILRDVSAVVIGAFAFQVVVVATVTFLIWFWMIQVYPANRLTAFTFLTPVFGVLFGGLLLGEAIGWRLVAGLALVTFGIYLVNRPPRVSADAIGPDGRPS
ncbi:drug/metabolite transporter (DMT)-like permease [Tepidamorphus gemmatus]|uniref:Drug/metabolite transporter (DMT)-like permease n=1 Tax=Tepidamorphus gemmatus TaxID=747076 RepID=A0A4R3MJM8_9HYPH|nr:DMT family transporter [Tepidamorphus gemmatus]TCT12782.1 drug/metabolite transporter (DMT)-like permease [Tepidamorphus gemmatus]